MKGKKGTMPNEFQAKKVCLGSVFLADLIVSRISYSLLKLVFERFHDERQYIGPKSQEDNVEILTALIQLSTHTMGFPAQCPQNKKNTKYLTPSKTYRFYKHPVLHSMNRPNS